MSFNAELEAMHADLFETLGEIGVFTPRVGPTVDPVHVILDEVTYTVGALGGAADARPSVQLPFAKVGASPRGVLVVSGRRFEIDRNVDADNDGYAVRVFVKETTAP